MAEHPYVPQSLHLPGYVPMQLSVIEILSGYGLSSLGVVLLVWFVSGQFRHLRGVERTLMCWWAFTGLTHIILEGYFVFTPDFYKRKPPNYFDDVWKEYCKGDSRYAARDSTIVMVEGITAVLEGPASLLVVYAIATRRAYNYPLQLAVCLGQLYGCMVYYGTPLLDGIEYTTAGSFYFWFYYIFMNCIWVVIPSLIALRSWTEIVRQFEHKKGKKQ